MLAWLLNLGFAATGGVASDPWITTTLNAQDRTTEVAAQDRTCVIDHDNIIEE